MKQLDQDRFSTLLKFSTVKPRLKRELRFTTSVQNLEPIDWLNTELIAIKDRSGNNGVLVIEVDSGTYILPFELQRISKSAVTGVEQPIICDFCKTWQAGSRAGSINFLNVKNAGTNAAYLCCEDLLCSSHVRNKTKAAKISRTQLRENIETPQRVQRLKDILEKLLTYLEVKPVELPN